MLVSRWTFSKAPLLRLSRRLLSDFAQPSGDTQPRDFAEDARYEDDANTVLRRQGYRPRPQRESQSTVEKPTVVVPVEVKMPEIEGESDIDRAIRSHNTSLYNLQGQAIVGRVVSVGQRDVSVDLGWKDIQTFMKSELTLSQIYRRVSEKKRKEGDFRPGDELRFRIEEIGTPHGQIFVSTQKMRADVRQRLVWSEIRDCYRKGLPVSGRVLNPCNAGYAIGVAGFVAFCPLNRLRPNSARNIGVLMSFLVDGMGEKIGNNLIVVDPHTHFGSNRGNIEERATRESLGIMSKVPNSSY